MATQQRDRNALASHAREIPSLEERDAYLAEACGEDAELKRQVEEQVAAQAESHEQPPDRLGPYKIVKRVGEGIAGVVFQAEQQEPVHLTVALKVIKPGRDGRQIVARFESERQTLTRLDHPNLAKLLGVGTSRAGQPYFVMEWVEGVPIITYCDEHQLALRERLELFHSVCEAVGYAHRKGVIHGDLKPSNVLVADREGKPSPKILDFGVAKATRRDNGSSTAPGGRPEYRSPDRADADNADVDTSSDVYSLGAMLYELLTGTTPLTRERLQDVSAAEAARLIREESAPPPSQRLSESKDALASIAAKRQRKPAALVKDVRGELDCLVMKALEKDRGRRYETANALARDLQHYLAHEPLEACPPRASYQLKSLARKHSRVSAAAAALLLLLVAAVAAGAALTLWAFHKEKQAQQAEKKAVEKSKDSEKAETKAKDKLHQVEAARKAVAKERDRAQEGEKSARHSESDMKAVQKFFKDNLLSAGRPSGKSLANAFWAGGRGEDVTLLKAVDTAEPKVAAAFADRPLGEATVREMLGLAYSNLNEPAKAVKQYKRAFDLRLEMRGDDNPETADCRNKLAVAYREAGRPDDASRLFHRDPHSPARADALAVRGTILLSQKKPEQAEVKLRESLNIRQKIQPDDWTTFDTQSLLGEALLDQKKYTDAEPMLLEGYRGMKKSEDDLSSEEKSHLTQALQRLVQLYEAWDKKDEAAKWRKELETRKK